MMQRLEGDIVTPEGVVAGHLELDGARIAAVRGTPITQTTRPIQERSPA